MAISQSGDSTSIPSFLGVSCCRRRGVCVGVGVVMVLVVLEEYQSIQSIQSEALFLSEQF